MCAVVAGDVLWIKATIVINYCSYNDDNTQNVKAEFVLLMMTMMMLKKR